MTYRRQQLLATITDNLAFSSKSVALENMIGLFDSNRVAQDFFCGLFRLVFGYDQLRELDKLNGIVNYPAIDLGDKKARVAIQITVDSSSTKIHDTVSKFNSHKLYDQYDRLIIFIIGQKIDHKKINVDTHGHFCFDQNSDVWDDNYLIKQIDGIESISDLELIESFLVKNLMEYKFPDRLYPQDIKTSIEILAEGMGELLSDTVSESVLKPIDRGDDFIEKKNIANEITWEIFKERMEGHLKYGPRIHDFLTDPINAELQNEYFRITQSIQQFYLDNKDKYKLEEVFREIFSRLPNKYDNNMDVNKVKILLHNMYFNCDIGRKPNV